MTNYNENETVMAEVQEEQETRPNGKEPPEHGSWWPINLGPVINGNRQRPQPTVGLRED